MPVKAAQSIRCLAGLGRGQAEGKKPILNPTQQLTSPPFRPPPVVWVRAAVSRVRGNPFPAPPRH